MRMDIRKLQYFIAVAEELHFNGAAEKLKMTQPAISVGALGAERFIMFPHHLGASFHDHIIGFCAKHGVYPNVYDCQPGLSASSAA